MQTRQGSGENERSTRGGAGVEREDERKLESRSNSSKLGGVRRDRPSAASIRYLRLNARTHGQTDGRTEVVLSGRRTGERERESLGRRAVEGRRKREGGWSEQSIGKSLALKLRCAGRRR